MIRTIFGDALKTMVVMTGVHFGIGSNDPKGWDKLLPLLKIVADQGQKWNNPNQTKPIPNVEYYIYRFEQYSCSIILKLFNNGGQYSISDAYPIP